MPDLLVLFHQTGNVTPVYQFRLNRTTILTQSPFDQVLLDCKDPDTFFQQPFQVLRRDAQDD